MMRSVKLSAKILKIISTRNDEKLKLNVLKAIELEPLWLRSKIVVIVQEGIITLTGTVNSEEEKRCLAHAVKMVAGVYAIIDNIVLNSENHKTEIVFPKVKKIKRQVKPATADDREKVAIENALVCNLSIDEHGIHVNVFGNKVTLSGIVHSMDQKDEAERIAWNAPGVWNVHNELLIDQAAL